MGVISDDCDSLQNHAIDRGEVEEVNKATVPSRADCRAIAIVDGNSAKSSVKRQLTTATPASAIERLKEKANYNEAYKKSNNEKHDLGVKRLKLNEDELSLKRLEVKARQDEVRAQNLERYYADLRLDLKDARDNYDNKEVALMKEEMRKVQLERRELSMTTN